MSGRRRGVPELRMWYNPRVAARLLLRPLHAELQRRYALAARIRRAFEVCR